ncbi:hypothetical protein TWF481_011581 [Arthrobotrys musiformis]|uniref:Hydrophobin n=1 Tax=Arthrobotrys musiformis TaxID=47236 RepID=A0AAV9VYZ1_9PEZI
MKFFTICVAAFFAGAYALPHAAPASKGVPYQPCSQAGLSDSRGTCCDTVVLGAASLGCGPPSRAPTSAKDFTSICKGKTPVCCSTDPLKGTAVLLCSAPVGF